MNNYPITLEEDIELNELELYFKSYFTNKKYTCRGMFENEEKSNTIWQESFL